MNVGKSAWWHRFVHPQKAADYPPGTHQTLVVLKWLDWGMSFFLSRKSRRRGRKGSKAIVPCCSAKLAASPWSRVPQRREMTNQESSRRHHFENGGLLGCLSPCPAVDSGSFLVGPKCTRPRNFITIHISRGSEWHTSFEQISMPTIIKLFYTKNKIDKFLCYFSV